jgi:hypothetical protein
MKESPRWLATKHKNELALKNLAWIRKTSEDDPETQAEFAEIIAAVEEEESVVGGRSWKEAFAPGNRIRFFIAFAGEYLRLHYDPTIAERAHVNSLYLPTVVRPEQYQLLRS